MCIKITDICLYMFNDNININEFKYKQNDLKDVLKNI